MGQCNFEELNSLILVSFGGSQRALQEEPTTQAFICKRRKISVLHTHTRARNETKWLTQKILLSLRWSRCRKRTITANYKHQWKEVI